MTTDTLGPFFYGQPFVAFDMHLVDGRTIGVPHPEVATIAEHGTSVLVVDDAGRPEIIDTALIVSCKFRQPVSDLY